jgi:hypothetical protein
VRGVFNEGNRGKLRASEGRAANDIIGLGPVGGDAVKGGLVTRPWDSRDMQWVKINWRTVAVLALAALALGGCSRHHWTSDHPDVAARAQSNPEAFVGPALEHWDELQGLGGSYSMRISKGIGRGSADLAIYVRRPADLDISVLAPTGAIEASLRVNEFEVGLSFLEDRIVYRGPSSGAAFVRALGFDLSAADAVAVLLGYGIPNGELPGATTTWDAAARRIRIETRSGTRAWLHPVTQRFDRIIRGRPGNPTGMVTATLTSWLDQLPIPDALRFDVEPDGYGIELRLSGAPTVNPDFPPGFFDVQVPAGFEVRPLSELGAEGGLFRTGAPRDSE